jgi:hypothetical protein
MSDKITQRALSWNSLPGYYQARKAESIHGDIKPAIGLTEPAPCIYRTLLPTFQSDDTEVEAYKNSMLILQRHGQLYCALAGSF